jgi:signal transduction histidine kinase
VVDIELSDEEGVLTLEVRDNGRGLDSHALQKPHSFGLLGLRERATKVGGWLDVSSSPRGTAVILSVPLEDGSHRHTADANDEGGADDPGDLV